jgi:hypothetical protein
MDNASNNNTAMEWLSDLLDERDITYDPQQQRLRYAHSFSNSLN